MMRTLLLTPMWWGLLLAAGFLYATPAMAHPDIDAAKAAAAQGEFRAALARLARAEESPSLTEEDMVELLWYRGFYQQARGKVPEANRAFDAVLALRPLHKPDEYDTPPDILEAFKRRSVLYHQSHGVDLGAPLLASGALVVPVTRHAESVEKVTAFVRLGGTKIFKNFSARVVGGEARVLLADQGLMEQMVHTPNVEVVVEARSWSGVPIARLGEAARPLALPVPAGWAPPEKPPELVETLPTGATASGNVASTPSPVAPGSGSTPGVAHALPADQAPPSRNWALVMGGAGVGVAAGVALLVGVVCVLLTGAALLTFGGTYYTLGNKEGVMTSDQYPVLVAVERGSQVLIWITGGLAGAFLVLALGTGAGAALLLVLGLRQ